MTPSSHAPRQAIAIFTRNAMLEARQRGFGAGAARLFAPTVNGAALGDAALHVFGDGPMPGETAHGARWHQQVGRTFGERLDNLFATLAEAGYEQIVVVGSDCPGLTDADLTAALAALAGGTRLVLGPNLRGGCYLIGIDLAARERLVGVRWCAGTDFAELRDRFAGEPQAILAAKRDLHWRADVVAARWEAASARLRQLAASVVAMLMVAETPTDWNRASPTAALRGWWPPALAP